MGPMGLLVPIVILDTLALGVRWPCVPIGPWAPLALGPDSPMAVRAHCFLGPVGPLAPRMGPLDSLALGGQLALLALGTHWALGPRIAH